MRFLWTSPRAFESSGERSPTSKLRGSGDKNAGWTGRDTYCACAFNFTAGSCKIEKKKSIMRRSKRLQAKKSATFSETEGSSQEEAVDIASLDKEDLVSKAYAEKITTDRQEEVDEDACTSSERITSSQEVEDVSTSSERMILSLQEEAEEDDEEEEEFLTLPTEFKRKFKKE